MSGKRRPKKTSETPWGLTFHPELFSERTRVMEALSRCGYSWFTHYGSIDLDHEQYGLEVCGIRRERDAIAIDAILRDIYPEWRHGQVFFEDCGLDIGWKVERSRDPQT